MSVGGFYILVRSMHCCVAKAAGLLMHAQCLLSKWPASECNALQVAVMCNMSVLLVCCGTWALKGAPEQSLYTNLAIEIYWQEQLS